MPRMPTFTVVDETTLKIHSSSFFEACTLEWQALLDWCRLHGLDPERMPSAGQTIVRDVARCRVVYDEYVMSADEVQHRRQRGQMYDGEPVRRRVHAQGETPPMPFPDVILAHLKPPDLRVVEVANPHAPTVAELEAGLPIGHLVQRVDISWRGRGA